MFAGLFRRDGGPVGAEDVNAMTRALPGARGGAAGGWAAGCVGMGPLASLDAAHQLAVAGDLALTNAAALVAALGLQSDLPQTDADVVLAAYLRWGERLPERLDGDFSFALWDGRRRLLLCARDRLGVKPLYFHLSPLAMAFAGDAGAVLGFPEVPRRLNQAAVAAYLTATFDDKTATGYLDVTRLAPGQTLVVDGEQATFRTYWSPDPTTELRLGSDAEYEEAFRHALTEAVASRVGRGPVGVSLSGGLDSSSVACIAARLDSGPLHAYTAVFDADPAADERPWAAAVVERCGAVARECRPSSTSPLADWEGAPWKGGLPACNPQVSVCRVTLEAAADDGVPVVLHGFGGDSVVSKGLVYLAELVGSGRLVRAAVEAEALSRRHGVTRRRVVRAYAVGPFVPDAAMRAWTWVRRRPVQRSTPLLRPEVARRWGLDGRIGAPRARTARQYHVSEVSAGLQSHVLEASRRVDAVVGVERRYPFLDRRLVELCLSLPGDQKLREGWTRSVMRRALAGMLPEEVRRRPGKANLGPPFVRALGSTDRAVLEAVVARPGVLGEWVDPSSLSGLWQRCRAGGGDHDWFALWRVAVAARWLGHHGFDDPPGSAPEMPVGH